MTQINNIYSIAIVRDNDVIVYNNANGRSYVLPIHTTDEGEKYIVVSGERHYM